MIYLTDEALKKHITETEDMLLGLKQERMARELRLAESLLPAFAEKVRQHFGPHARVKTDTDQYDLNAMLVIEIPPSISFEDATKLDYQFIEDPEVLEKFCSKLSCSMCFVTE